MPFFPVWPLIASVLFLELLHLYLFVTILNVANSLNHIFFILGESHPLFNVWTATHVLQFSSGTVPLHFVWLSHTALSLTINLLIVSFSFIYYPYFWTATPFCLFSEWNSSLCECHTNALCTLSLIFVRMSHMRVSIFFVWMSHEYPCVSLTFKWTRHVVSFQVMTDPFSF